MPGLKPSSFAGPWPWDSTGLSHTTQYPDYHTPIAVTSGSYRSTFFALLLALASLVATNVFVRLAT